MSVEKKINYKDKKLTKAQQKKAKAINSAGIKNYLNEQETVTVPKKWLSSPDHVVAELAYITPREQKILLDADLYGSLNGQPNRGPGGIMSLQGAGDGGGSENAGTDDKGNSMGGGTGPSVQAPPGVRSNPTAPTDGTEGTLSDPREKFDFVGNTTFGPTQKYTGGGFFSGANKYGYRDVDTNPFSKNYGDTKPGYAGRIIGGLGSLLTGIPFVGGVLGNMYDKGKGIFGPKQKDMSQFNNLGLYTDRPQSTGRYGTPTQQGDYDIYGNKINELTGEILDPVTGEVIDTIPGYPGEGQGSTTTNGGGGGGGITSLPTAPALVEDQIDDSVDDLLLRFYGKDKTKDFASLGYDNAAELRKSILERTKNLYT